ncbi:MAG: 4-(cytidine 5'-diphospho)-2-C-methyl-D-erythritol kinase [Bacteroidota bacterium]
MQTKSYAKINLGLQIIGRRNDGYHNIETIFHRIDLFDEIILDRSPSLSLHCDDPIIPTDEKNLCWQAAEVFGKETGITEGISITIKKRIPSGAGLGGGSSNAAATLLALQKLFSVTIERARLESLALTLGSDVPYFLQYGTAYGEGRGERLSYFPLPMPYRIALINPGIHVSTPWAYGALAARLGGQFPKRPNLREIFSSSADITKLRNDFEETVFERYPEIASIKKTMLERGAVHALMSGSGSSVFGLFEREADARSAMDIYAGKYFTHYTGPEFLPEHA